MKCSVLVVFMCCVGCHVTNDSPIDLSMRDGEPTENAASRPSTITPAEVINATPERSASKYTTRRALIRMAKQSQLMFRPEGEGHGAYSPTGHWMASLGEGGWLVMAQMRPSARDVAKTPWQVNVSLLNWGRAGAQMYSPASSQRGHVEGAWKTYDHGNGLTEWYHHRHDGLEHGFVVATRPEGAGNLVLTMAVTGGQIEQVSDDRIDVVAQGQRLRYDSLKVWDAHGKPLRAMMRAVQGTKAQLVVDDAGAAYPLTVDPLWTVQNVLEPEFVAANAFGGERVAIHGDMAMVSLPGYSGRVSNGGAVLVYKFVASGSWFLKQVLVPSDNQSDDFFGSSLSMSSDYAAIGAIEDDDQGINAGAAYVYAKNPDGSWVESQKVYAINPAANDAFSEGISIDNDTLAVGSPGRSGGGAVSIFERDGGNVWQPAIELSASNTVDGDGFGESLAVVSNRLLVGAPDKDNTFGVEGGAAYLYTKTATWGGEIEITPSDGGPGAHFGDSVSMDTNNMAIGAPGQDVDQNFEDGAVFVYDVATRQSEEIINNPQGQSFAHFGQEVVIDGSWLLVGIEDVSGDGAVGAFEFTMGRWLQQSLLQPQPLTNGDAFGGAVAFHGTLAITGAPLNGNLISNGGAAHTFDRSSGSWIYQTKLVGEAATDNAEFGLDVAISGDYAVVGAPQSDTLSLFSGIAFVYKRDVNGQWRFHQSLLAGVTSSANFGSSVTIDGDTIAVSARNDTANEPNAGAVYIFNQTIDGFWRFHQKVVAPDGASNDDYGGRIKMDGDDLIVGAEDNDMERGSAYIYHRDAQGAWIWQATLVPPSTVAGDNFGNDVDIQGDTAIVGAFSDDNNVGRVYVFERDAQNTWNEVQQLTRSTNQDDKFGKAVSIDGDVLAIGARGEDGNRGTVHIFTRTMMGWSFEQSLQEPIRYTDSVFGNSLSLKDGRLIVGALGSDKYTANAGAYYVFRRLNTGVWVEQDVDMLGNLAAFDQFGWVVEIDQGTVIVSARRAGRAGGIAFFDEPPNAAPVASDISTALDEDTPTMITISASDPENDPLFYSVITQPSNGTLSGQLPSVIYTPNMDFNGADNFVVNVTDGIEDIQVTVLLTIDPVNDQPLAFASDPTTTEDQSVMGTLSGFDADNDMLTYQITALPQNGSVLITDQGTGAYMYTPNQDFNGIDSFAFVVNDGTVDSTPVVLNVTVTAEPDVPIAQGDTFTIMEDQPLQGRLQGDDPDGDAITFEALSAPANGTFTLVDNMTGDFEYVPDENFNGTDRFGFRVRAGEASSEVFVDITITPVNDAPTLSTSNVRGPEDTTLPGTLASDDVEGDVVTYRVLVQPMNAVFTLNNAMTGAFEITPTPNYFGSDSVLIEVSDGNGGVGMGSVSLGWTPVDDRPVGMDSSVTVPAGVSSEIEVSGSDVEGDAFTFTITNMPLNGDLDTSSFAQSGKLLYTPKPNVTSDQLGFQLVQTNDTGVRSATYVVDITITNNVNPGDLIVTSPEENEVVESDTFDVTGTTSANATVTFSMEDVYGDNVLPDDAAVTADAQGVFVYTIPDPVSNSTYTLTASSGALTATRTFDVAVLGATTPTVEGTEVENGIIILPEGEKSILTGMGPAGATVEVFIGDSEDPITTTVNEDGVWSIALPADLGDGVIDVRVVITDKDGKKATVRLKVRSTNWSPDGFDRVGCQHTHHRPGGLASLLFFVFGFVYLRRRTMSASA